MIKIGFEVEYFFTDRLTGKIVFPEHNSVDDSRILAEYRSRASYSVFQEYADICAERLKYDHASLAKFNSIVDPLIYKHKLSAGDRIEIRKRANGKTKSFSEVRNVYNYKQRLLNGWITASWQINLSNVVSISQTIFHGKEQFTSPTVYGLLDIPKIIRGLDLLFADEIKAAKRQAGMYCIKNDYRLEYRSLPNFAFTERNIVKLHDFLLTC